MFEEKIMKPKYENCCSYYGKARIKEGVNKISLISYNTEVCCIDSLGNFHRLWDGYSATTMRHINEFIRQNNISGGGKAWWVSLPVEEDLKS